MSIAGEESVCDVGEAGGSVIGEAGAGSCPPKPSASLHPVACHCVHSESSRHPVARPGASRSVFAPPIHMAMGGHGFREGTVCRLPDRAGALVFGGEGMR